MLCQHFTALLPTSQIQGFRFNMKVQFGIFKTFGYEKLVLIGNHLYGKRTTTYKEDVLKFLGNLLEKDEEYLELFVEVKKRPCGVEISKGGEKVVCFYV